MEPEARWFTSQRLRLRYWVWGDETKPPMILVHGTRDHARSWDRTAEMLADRYTVYAPDLRGHGDSDATIGGAYSIPEYLVDLHALTRAIGRGPYSLLGHSVGGSVCVLYAAAFPEDVKRVVTLEGLGSDWRPAKPPGEQLREWVLTSRGFEGRTPRTFASLEEAAERMREANPHLAPELAGHLAAHGTKELPDGSVGWKFDVYSRSDFPLPFGMEQARPFWREVRCPVLLLWSEEGWSAEFEASGALREFADAEGIMVRDAGHHLHHDQFETFMGHVEAFLTRTDSGRR